MNKSFWKNEIERKYKLQNQNDLDNAKEKLIKLGFKKTIYVKQLDWIPDFKGFLMRNSGILLRIRTIKYYSGKGPTWIITLKKRSKSKGIHKNKELEISSEDHKFIPEVIQELKSLTGISIILEKILNQDADYLLQIGLTEHRMIIEKKRQTWISETLDANIAIDELPLPLGYFIELEVNSSETELLKAELVLGFNSLQIVERDYGEIVKEITGMRKLLFSR